MNDEIAVIVYSCWRNRDMWSVFSFFVNKYWQNRTVSIVLLTDYYEEDGAKYAFDKIISIDDAWGTMLKTALLELGCPYIMLFMDDYLICDYIDEAQLLMQLERAKEYNVSNIRLVESPKCNYRYEKNASLGCYIWGEPYSLSTQVGIWNKDFLLSIIDNAWSPWDFERRASLKGFGVASDAIEHMPILVSLDYTFPYVEGVRKGKWMYEGAALCKRNGIDLSTMSRPVMTNMDMAKIYFQGALLEKTGKYIIKLQIMRDRLKTVGK